jgi:pyruvate kinase
MLTALYDNGVNIVRFNFSHAYYDEAEFRIKNIKALNASGRTKFSMLLDTKGPEIRTGDKAEKYDYVTGEKFKMVVRSEDVDSNQTLFCDYPHIVDDIEAGSTIVIDSGVFNVRVLEKHEHHLLVEALNCARIGSRRHINLPGLHLKLPGLMDQDKKDVLFGIKHGFHLIAMSFVRNAANVQELREFLDQNGAPHIKIMSKIETQEAIDNLDEIIEASDGIMVARGDLGIEVPIEQLPTYQRIIIEKCQKKGKFHTVATHMLESMIENPFPTRAEVSDVFNSARQRPDTLMLSGETAMGKFPIEAATMMNRIIMEAEKTVHNKHHDFDDVMYTEEGTIKKALIRNALFLSEQLTAKAILVFTKTGALARFAAALRPNLPVFAFTLYPDTELYANILY